MHGEGAINEIKRCAKRRDAESRQLAVATATSATTTTTATTSAERVALTAIGVELQVRRVRVSGGA